MTVTSIFINNGRLLPKIILKYAVDPEIENSFDSYEDLEYDFGKGINPDPETVEMDKLDRDLWLDYWRNLSVMVNSYSLFSRN